jgi:hypothetical protein
LYQQNVNIHHFFTTNISVIVVVVVVVVVVVAFVEVFDVTHFFFIDFGSFCQFL